MATRWISLHALPRSSVRIQQPGPKSGAGRWYARSVTVVEAQGRTRLIVNLTALVPYSTRVDGNNLFVVLGESSGTTSPAAASAAVTAPIAKPAPVKPMAAGKAIDNIDFRRGEDGAGNVVITLSDPSVGSTIEEQGGKIRVVFAKAELPEALRVRLDVQDFATPVKFVDSTAQAGGASIAIEPTGRYDYLAYQTDNKLTISVKPLQKKRPISARQTVSPIPVKNCR